MTEEDIQEVISAIKRQSQPVETLEAESDIKAVSSLLAMRGDTMIRAPISIIQQLLGIIGGEEDIATRALLGTTLPFNGFVSNVNLKPTGFVEWQDIVFDSARKVFLAKSFIDYSLSWTTQSDYMTEDGTPRSGRIYISNTGTIYYWDDAEKELKPVKCDVTQSLSFTFDKSDTEWVVKHNLLRKPAVTVTDIDGHEIECDVIHISDIELRIIFGKPVSGTVILT